MDDSDDYEHLGERDDDHYYERLPGKGPPPVKIARKFPDRPSALHGALDSDDSYMDTGSIGSPKLKPRKKSFRGEPSSGVYENFEPEYMDMGGVTPGKCRHSAEPLDPHHCGHLKQPPLLPPEPEPELEDTYMNPDSIGGSSSTSGHLADLESSVSMGLPSSSSGYTDMGGSRRSGRSLHSPILQHYSGVIAPKPPRIGLDSEMDSESDSDYEELIIRTPPESKYRYPRELPVDVPREMAVDVPSDFEEPRERRRSLMFERGSDIRGRKKGR